MSATMIGPNDFIDAEFVDIDDDSTFDTGPGTEADFDTGIEADDDVASDHELAGFLDRTKPYGDIRATFDLPLMAADIVAAAAALDVPVDILTGAIEELAGVPEPSPPPPPRPKPWLAAVNDFHAAGRELQRRQLQARHRR